MWKLALRQRSTHQVVFKNRPALLNVFSTQSNIQITNLQSYMFSSKVDEDLLGNPDKADKPKRGRPKKIVG
jgi:hypothetical protein